MMIYYKGKKVTFNNWIPASYDYRENLHYKVGMSLIGYDSDGNEYSALGDVNHDRICYADEDTIMKG